MKINQMDIEFTADGKYRPNALIINGEPASMSNFLKAHGYNWMASAYGNILFYRTDSCKEYKVYQTDLMKKERN